MQSTQMQLEIQITIKYSLSLLQYSTYEAKEGGRLYVNLNLMSMVLELYCDVVRTCVLVCELQQRAQFRLKYCFLPAGRGKKGNLLPAAAADPKTCNF